MNLDFLREKAVNVLSETLNEDSASTNKKTGVSMSINHITGEIKVFLEYQVLDKDENLTDKTSIRQSRCIKTSFDCDKDDLKLTDKQFIDKHLKPSANVIANSISEENRVWRGRN